MLADILPLRSIAVLINIREQSLITGGGGYKTGEGGGANHFFPLQKSWTENVLAVLKGGGGGSLQIPFEGGGAEKFNPVSRR